MLTKTNLLTFFKPTQQFLFVKTVNMYLKLINLHTNFKFLYNYFVKIYFFQFQFLSYFLSLTTLFKFKSYLI